MKKSIIAVGLLAAAVAPLSAFATGYCNTSNCKPTSGDLTSGYRFDGRSVGMTIPAGPAHYANCVVTNPVKEPTDLQIVVNHKVQSGRIKGDSTAPQPLNVVLKGGDYLVFNQVTPKKFGANMKTNRYVLQCGLQVTAK